MNIEEIISHNITGCSDEYKNFAIDKNSCTKCSIYNHYEQVVQSEGQVNKPTFMFIGECPGGDEVKQIKPFIGKAGQRLRSELKKYPNIFNKNTSLISNLLPCRPLNNKFPNNCETYTVDGRETDCYDLIDACSSLWIKKEIAIVRPKVIVFLGNQSLKYLTNRKGITNNRGNWFFEYCYRAWCFATYHPSYVIRCEKMKTKADIVNQFQDDIHKIAHNWSTYCYSDDRLDMNEEEWHNEKVGKIMIDNRLVEPKAIENFV